MPEFKLNGKTYDIPEDIVEQFLKDNPSAEALGKTTPTAPGAVVEETAAPELTLTESPSVDTSLDLPEVKTDTVDSTIDLKPKKERAGFLGSIALSPSKIPANIQKQEIGLRDMVLLTIDRWINPELSREERVAKLNEYFNSEDDPTAGYPGLGIIRTADTKQEAENVVREIRDKQLKTESQSISESIKKGNVVDAAFLATDGLIQTLPSIAFSAYGAGGIITHGALIAGEKFNDEYLNNPKASESAIIANALGTGAIQAGADFLFRGLMKTTGVLAKEGSATQAKQFLSNSISRVATKYLAIPAEGLVEVSQDLATKGLDDLTFGRDFYKNINKYELIDNFLLGTLMQGGVTVTSYMGNANKDQRAYAEGLLMPENIKPQLASYAENYSKIANQINKEQNPNVKEILKNQLLDIEGKISTLRRKYKTSLYAMNSNELTEYAKNKDLIEKYKSSIDKASTQESRRVIFKEIDKLNKANAEILKDATTKKFQETTTKAEAAAKKLGVKFNVIESSQQFDEYVKSKGADATEIYSKDDGTILQYPDGRQEIIINQETALKERSVNVASHELLHAVLFRTLQNKDGAAKNLADALTEEIAKIDINKVTNSDIMNRLRNYSSMSEAVQYEEILTLFSDAIATGDIKFEESIFTKIGNVTKKLFKGFNEDIKFDSGRDVYNFIKDFNNSVDEGIVKGAKEGFKGKLISKISKDINRVVSKQSKSISGENIQKIFDEKGKDGTFEIIEAYKPLTTKLTNKYRDVPGFDFELLQSEIEIGKRGLLDLINSYDPSKGATLNTYIQGQLANRSIEAANRILDTEFKLDVTEAKGVTDTVTAEEIIEREEAAPVDEIKSLRKEIGLSEELVTKVKDAVVKTFGTKLPNPQDSKFRFELQKRFRTELKKPLSKFVGKQADYEAFLRDNFESVYNKMPQSLINRRFKEFAKPVLDKNGKQLRERTAEGNKVYVKKKISKAEWIKYFIGADVKSSTKGARKTAIVEGMAEEIAFDATMEVLDNPDVILKYQDIAGITGEVLPENFKSLIAKQVDRAEDFKFSKSITNDAKAEYNLESQELAKILDKTSLDKLSNKYSLISDAIIYKADPINIKFSLTTKAEGKWEQEPLNPLDESSKLYKFKVGEIDYEIRTFKNAPAPDYSVFKQTEGIALREAIDNDPKSWNMTFADADTGSTDVTGVAAEGLTNQFKVFGTVANSAIDLIKNEKLNSITFTAKEKSRKRLYKSLNEKFANELEWETYDYEIRTPDGEETVFVAYDPQAFSVEEVVNPPQIKFSNSNSKFNVTAKKLLTPEGWAKWSNAKLEGSKILQDEIGDIKTQLGSQRPSYIVSENELKGFDKLKPKEKKILRKKIKDLRKSIISYKAKTNFNILKPGESFGNPAEKFGRNAIEIKNNIENGNIFKLQNTYSRVYDSMWEKYYNILEKNPDMFDFLESTLQTSSNDVSHWHRLGAIFLGYDPTALKTFAVDKDGNKKFKTIYAKDGKETKIPITRTFEYEHAVQNHIQWKRVLNAAKRFAKNKNKKGFLDYLKKSKEDYVLIAISVADSKKINEAGYAHVMPKNWKKWVDRYIASNIDLNKIVNISYSNNNAFIEKNINSIFVQKFSKSLNKEFNKILEQSTDINWARRFSPVEARVMGKGKGKKFFIPYSADDFVGLLYATLGTKKQGGNEQMEWYKENLLRPFSRGIQQYEAAKQQALRDWQVLKKEAKKDVPGGLDKKNATGLSNQDAVRIYIWATQGMDIPGTEGSPELVQQNLEVVKANEKLKAFADRLMALNPEGYPEPSDNWDSGDITTDIVSYINGVKRSEFLTEWKENVDEIFSDQNKEKLRALYGDTYIEALEDILHRMRTGTNRKFGVSKIERQFMDWTNNSVGAIMFFNARSAVLQTLSAVNFINFSDNNPINAGIAFANQRQYWNDFSTLFNSNFLKQRRTGLQTDVNADEIARAAKTSTNKARAALSALLKFGFTPTQIADSFAIASGGATFYRNRIKKYLKEGLEQKEAEQKAFTDFQEIAEETQQSARPDRISLQQASSLGRLVLAFGNTPMQYARLTKKATLDLINGRGDWKTNISKIAYYSVIQNIIFSALQQGLFALLFDDEDDDKEKSRLFRIGNSSFDTLLRGAGVYGAAAATVKNMIIKVIEETKKSRPDYTKVAIEATAISPPINSKLRKLVSAGKTFTYKQSKEKVFTEGFSLENPAFLAGGKILSATTNLPADRIVQKADHLYTAMQPETELWQSIALSLGWSEWDLNMIEKQTKKPKKIQPNFKTKSFKSDFKTKKFKT
jgi:hypothetical protein